MRILAAVLLLLAAAAAAKVKPLASYFNVCKRSLPHDELGKCVVNTLHKSRARLVKGIPELGLLPIDPMRVDRIEMKDNNNNFRFSQTLSNLTIYGLGDYEVKDVSIDTSTFGTNITMFAKKMRFESAYEMDGQILVIPIKGSGHATFNFTDVTMTNYIKFKTVKKGNKNYFKIDKYKLTIEPQGAHSHFTNLFNGDKRLGDATNRLLNENWREAFNTYRQLPEEAFGELIQQMSSVFYERYTIDEMFPE